MQRALRPATITAIYLAVYVGAAEWSRAFAGFAGLSVWFLPPAATLVLLLLAGPRFAPAVLLAEWTSAVVVFGFSPLDDGWFLAANAAITAVIYTAAALVLRPRVDPTLPRLRDLLWLTLVGCTLTPLVEATVTLLLQPRPEVVDLPGLLEAIRLWWVGGAIGLVSAAPPALLFLSRLRAGWRPQLSPLPRIWVEASLQTVLLLLTPVYVFALSDGATRGLRAVVFLPLVWIALRHGLPGATLAVLGLTMTSTVLANAQLGPGLTFTDLQTVLVVLALIGLSIGGVVTERDTVERERRDAERRLRQLEEQLARSRRMQSLGRLAGGIAHDFNNLLTVITGYTELLAERLRTTHGGVPPELGEIGDAATRAGRLIEELRAFSAGTPTTGERCPVDRTVRSLAANVDLLLGPERRLHLDLRAGAAEVPLGEVQLERILLNIATNSRDAMPAGGELRICTDLVPEPHGPVGVGDANRRVRLRFTDTGIGIPPDDLPHVLEPFYTSKPQGKGSGLGLATIYGLTQQVGGDLDLQSEVGVGTTVALTLPVAAASTATGALSMPPRVAVSPDGRSGRCLLVVDDDTGVRELMARTLTDHGDQVVTAADGDEALRLLARAGLRLDAVVTDVTMPGTSGPELLATLRARGSTLPVLLVSGYASAARILVDDVPGQAFLSKPFTPSELLAALEGLLRRAAGTGAVVGRDAS